MQAAIGVTISLPTGFTSHFIPAASLGSGTSAVADVWFTDSYKAYTISEQTTIRTFVQQGGGLVLGGQVRHHRASWPAAPASL